MKRWIVLGSALTALLLALFSWALYFLFWTPGGVHWLLGKVPQYSPLKIQVDKVTGRIAGDLEMEGLQVWWAGGLLNIQRLQTSLQPQHLLRGKILFEKILVKKISLEEKQVKPEPLDLTLPRVTGFLSRLDLEIRSLLLEEIRYRINDDPPWVINKMSGRLAWNQGTLAVNPLEVGLDQGHLKGALGLGLAVPSLGLDVLFYPDTPLLGTDHLHLQALLKEGRSPNQLAGPLTVTRRSGSADRMVFRSDLGIAPHQITLRNISFLEKGRKGTVGGQGNLLFEAAGPQFRTDLKLTDVDLSPELKIPASLTGDLHWEGTPSRYDGRFDLKNNALTWQAFRLAGSFQGNDSGVEVALDQGDWLQGAFNGRVGLTWGKAFALRADLAGRQIRPEGLHAGWPGIINLDLKGGLLWSEAGLILENLDLRLLESQLRGKPLKGGVLADWGDDHLSIKKASLQGRGFNLTADGVLDERLEFEARVADLSALLPDGQGTGSAKGWVRWRNRKLGGQILFQGRDLSWKNVKGGTVDLEADYDQEKKDTAIDLKAQIKKGTYDSFPVDFLNLQVQGTLARQGITFSALTPQGTVQAGLKGAYDQKRWQGTLATLSGEIPRGKAFRLQSPADLVISPDRFQLSSLVLTGEGEERLTFDGGLGLKPLSGSIRVEWQRLNLARTRPWLEKLKPEGWTAGSLQARFPGDDRMELRLQNEMTGKFQAQGQTVSVKRSGFNLTWDNGGLRSSWEIKLSEGGTFSGQAASTDKARLAFPSQGTFLSSMEGFDLETWQTLLPAGLSARGRVGGRLQGQWSEGRRWKLAGNLKATGGSLAWKKNGAEFQARLSRADLGISWQDDSLRGNLALELENHGQASGDFSLPLSPRFPLKLRPSGPVQAHLSGKFQERGLVTALFPQAVRASSGKMQWDLTAQGTWEKPVLGGNFELSEAGADLPALGLRLKDISLQGTFSEDRIRIDSLVISSGPGTVNGQATFRLKDRKITGVEGRLTGKNFQFVNRPDFQALGSPDLNFRGAPDQLQRVGGRLQGQWSEGRRWKLAGNLKATGGSLAWKKNGAEFQARLSRADLGISWQDDSLRGNLALELENHGQASGDFSLPLSPRFPLKLRPSGPVQAHLSGKFQERGLVTALFPQAVRASSGKMQWDLTAQGTWEKPVLGGTLELSEAGADLPALGLRLKDISLQGTFSEDRIRIDSLVISSGPGTVNGQATFRLKDRKITGVEGKLTGKNFRFVNRPDIQALGSPDLTFRGALNQLQLGGRIEIPEALITGGSGQEVKKTSPDVVILDAPQTQTAARAFPIQGEITLVLGEKVRMKVDGFNTLLRGNVGVVLKNSKDLKAEGEIRTEQGYYLVQGSRLEITRGRLIFKGPPDNPWLDILALRTIRGTQRVADWVDEVKAGVMVTGTVRTPLVRLYSQPTMPDSDILSYILFGKPMGRGTDRTDLAILGKAARVLVGERAETSLISRLNLDSLDIQSSGGDVSRSIVTVGRYLGPRLYLGLGGSLFSNTYQIILRYALTPRLEVETKGGTQSGGGIFFKVDFE
jgi:translocation and assembly module TamB